MSLQLNFDQTAVQPCPVPLLLARDTTSSTLARQREPALTRIRPGAYVEADAWQALPPWDRYLTRVHAARAMLHNPVFSHESAASLLGLPVFGEPRDIHVMAGDEHARRRGDVVMHATDIPRFVCLDGEFVVTDLTETALDLGRVLPPAFALAVIDSVLTRMDIERGIALLRRRAAESPNRRGTRRLAWLWNRADPLSESPGESVSRAVIEWLGFASPALQVWFHSIGHDDRADFYWPDDAIIGEFDGHGKYGTSAHTSTRAVLDEKRREDRLRARARGFVRWEWRDVMEPQHLDARLRLAGVTRVAPVCQPMLATLRRNPRSK